MQYRRLLLACGGYFLLGGYLFMNLYHLRYFVTLAHMEHYTRAADLLAITQPSLSHAISSLESELGVKLFKKNGRNVTLTKYGKSFLTDAEDILQKLDSSAIYSLPVKVRGGSTLHSCELWEVILFPGSCVVFWMRIRENRSTLLCTAIK